MKERRPLEPDSPWLGGRRFWQAVGALAAVFVIGFLVQWYRVSNLRADPQEAFLYTQAELVPGLGGACRVFVRNGETSQPVPGAEVYVRLVSGDGREVWEGEVTTDDRGIAEALPAVPDDAPEGDYTLTVEAESDVGESTVKQTVKVTRSFRIMVSTDKPLYQPGQTIHIRSLALATSDHRPVGGRDLVIEVRDPKGNKVFKKPATTSDFGIASADFELADQVNLGSYTVAATLGDTVSEREVRVERYVLPKFKIDLATNKAYYPPGATVSGDLAARYTFGEPVAGARVRVVASEFIETFRPFATAEGETDAEGRFHFDLTLKDHFVGQERKKGDAFVTLEATVVDTADHTQKKSLDLTVTTDAIRIEVFPESGTLVQGVENILYVVTAYPDGRPAKTTLTMGRTSKRVETSSLGIAKVKITPRKPQLQLTLTAEDAQGAKTTAVRRLRIGDRSESILLRTDKAVYRGGETAHVTVLSAERVSRVFVDVVKERRAVLMKAIDMKDGRGELALDLPPDLFGTLELHAYRIMTDGNIVADTRIVQVARADALTIQAELDKDTYRPAETALLKFIVTRKRGEPTAAALSLAGVDEAVFALQEMRPGLERVYFALQEEILKPRYEICAHPPVTPAQAIQPPDRPEPELEEAAVVLFTSAEGRFPSLRAGPIEDFQAQRIRMQREKARGKQRFTIASLYALLVLLAIVLVPTFACTRRKLLRRVGRSMPSGIGHYGLRRASRNLLLSWCLSVAVGPLGLLARGIYGTETAVVGFTVLIAMVALFLVTVSVLRFLATAAARCDATLTRAVAALPFAYLIAVGTGAYALNSARGRLTGDNESAAYFVVVVGWFLLLATASSLMRLARGVRDPEPAGPGLGSILTRLAIGAGLLLLFFAMMIPGTMKMARRRFRVASQRLFHSTGAVYRDGAPAVADERAPSTGVPEAEGLRGASPRIRRHFPETLLWRPELITDEQGRAQLEVPLADSITTWRVAASAVSRRGELGAATAGIRVFQDFFVDIDFPVALTQNDVVTVPVAVYNYLDEAQDVRLDVEPADWFALSGSPTATLRVGPRQVTSATFQVQARTPGRHALLVRARGSRLADAVERVVRVEPDGRPVVQTVNARLDGSLTREIVIPREAIDGASDLVVKIYPGSFSQVIEGMESIFRMPHGCFEQTSSTTYPNVLVLDYLRRTKQAKPEVEMKALNFINLGYQRLLSFEVKGGGFEWFGKTPAHTVLTAYGLMEFCDMAKVHEVDPAVIERTRRWLLSQQHSDGAWAAGSLHHDTARGVGDPTLRTTAYVAWAVAASGQPDGRLKRALDYVAREADQAKDTYTLALCANALLAADRREARGILERLDSLKKQLDKVVWWSSAGEGATFSRGPVLDIETTALAACAFLEAGFRTDTAHKALAWLIEKKDSRGTWHSTQATVYAMRALLTGTGTAGGSVEGDLHAAVTANGALAKELTITPETADVYRLISLRPMVREGSNTVAIEAAGKGNLACQIVATHYVPWSGPAPEAAKPIRIDVRYDTTTLKANDMLTSRVTVQYNRAGVANMTIVDLGIPPGFDVQAADFDALKSRGVIERYSLTGRQATLYFRQLESGKPVEFTWRLRAKYPVKVKTPRSAVYQYYEPEIRDEAPPVELRVM